MHSFFWIYKHFLFQFIHYIFLLFYKKAEEHTSPEERNN